MIFCIPTWKPYLNHFLQMYEMAGWFFFAISNQILCHSKEAHKFALQLVFSLNVSMTGEIHFQTGRAILYQWNFHESQAILGVNEMY